MTRYMSKQSFIGTKQKREKTRQALTDHEFHEALTYEMINAPPKDNKPPLTHPPSPLQSHNPLILCVPQSSPVLFGASGQQGDQT